MAGHDGIQATGMTQDELFGRLERYRAGDPDTPTGR